MPKSASPTGGIPQVKIEFYLDQPLIEELVAYGERQTPALSRNQVIMTACAQLVGYRRADYLPSKETKEEIED